MRKQINQVKEFHKIYGLPVRYKPELLPFREMKLRSELLEEETAEIIDAHRQHNIEEVVDGIVDLLYVTIGLAVQMGVSDKLEECFDEVQRSNMSKLDSNGKPIVRSGGKILKGTNFIKPNLKDILSSEQSSE